MFAVIGMAQVVLSGMNVVSWVRVGQAQAKDWVDMVADEDEDEDEDEIHDETKAVQ